MSKIEPRLLRSFWIAAAVIGGVALLRILSTAHAAGAGYGSLVRHVAPSVVTILVQEKGVGAAQRAIATAAARDAERDSPGEVLRRLLTGPGINPPHRDGESALGSGFVVRADGMIVTNRHVIVDARVVKVKLATGEELTAKVIGTDAATDIALLKVNSAHLPVLKLGSSANVAVGDAVIAIGNPFGIGQSVSAGIISARGRTMEADPYIDFLQTDAAINLGNSGGPLLSTDGVVVGVNSAIFSPSGGSVGLGFAIPAEVVATVVSELEAKGHVERGYLGISAQPMTKAIARALGLTTPMGTLVTALEPDGPSVGALLVGDVLLSVGSVPVTYERLGRIAGRLKPGVTIEGIVLRDGTQHPVALKIGQLPDPPPDPALTGDSDTWVPSLELAVAKSTNLIRTSLKASGESAGLVVTQLRRTGAGGLAGLQLGDLVTHAGTKHLEDVSDLSKVSKPSVELPLLVRIIREGAPRFVAITGTDEK
jgi:serine protease Do